MYLPDAYGQERERKEHRKKKKKHRKSSHKHDDAYYQSSSDDGEVKKKKKERHHTEEGEVKKKKKTRAPEEEYLREAARRKSKPHSAAHYGDDANAELTKSSRSRRRSADRGIPEQSIPVHTRMEDDGQVDMRAFSTQRRSRELEPDEVDAAFGMSSQDLDPGFDVQHAINWETGEGITWPADNGVSVITPLTAFDEPNLREDVEDPFVPVTTSFSGVSPGSQNVRLRWQPEMTEQGPESDNDNLSRPGAHRVNPQYQAPLSRYSSDRRRNSPQITVRPGSLLSEKRKNTLPPGLYPIAETGEPPEKKKEKGPLSLFPVDESYDGGTTSRQKSHHRLSYSTTGESYSQSETEESTPGGRYVATRRMTSKRRRKKERGEGPAYFRSSERYNDENLMADPYDRIYEMEAQATGEDRLGAFAVRRTGVNVTGGPGVLAEHPTHSDRMDQVGRDQHNIVHVQAEEIEYPTEKHGWTGSRWFRLLVAFLLLVGVATAIAIPLTYSSNKSSEKSFSEEEVAFRKVQMQFLLEGVSDPSILSDKASPQHMACNWMATQDILSPLDNGLLSSGIKGLILQRYALAVFYYSTAGDDWFSAEGWLDGQQEECLWEFIECVNEDVVSIDTGARNNLVGVLPPEMKELKELRKCNL